MTIEETRKYFEKADLMCNIYASIGFILIFILCNTMCICDNYAKAEELRCVAGPSQTVKVTRVFYWSGSYHANVSGKFGSLLRRIYGDLPEVNKTYSFEIQYDNSVKFKLVD